MRYRSWILQATETTLESAAKHVLEITLSFAQLEHILGFELPLSAHKYHAWWANSNSPDQHPYA